MEWIKEIKSYLSYIGTICKTAFKETFGISQFVLSVVFFIIWIILWLLPQKFPQHKDSFSPLESIMNMNWWQATAIAFGLIILIRLALAPYWIYKKQRQEISKISQKEEGLEIEVGEVTIEPNGMVIANIALRLSKKMQLAKIILECSSKTVNGSIQGNVQLPHFIESGVNYNVEFQFFENVNDAGVWEIGEQMLIAHGQGRREAKLRITADAKEWESTTFPIPTKIQEPEFVLQYGASSISELFLEKDNRGYKMTLTLILWFKNGDDRNPMWIEKFARVGFDTILNNRSKEPYQLQNQDGGTIYLGPGEKKEIDYELVTWNYYVEPVLGDMVHCHWDEIGRVTMPGYGRLAKLKLLEPFDLKVHKSTSQSVSHEEGSQT